MLGLGRLAQAEEYLSQAQWTVVKTPECKNEIKSRLHRNLGMLYATQGNFEEASRHLAEDVSMQYFFFQQFFVFLKFVYIVLYFIKK